eukprot:CAMPEP_0114345532 /NCGR_PEP_ID=MMETSP0101-20121206/12308_1 /TAXON_ID=38822 ORGANISM="Pteridomonas danica, Strain PT" /NCGR_SAMPLE_ID=MMETSP0101 /ASSEMBLY_ACC=CAM_ASM_000211 /LENGTH=151 /DNA_ID=CAMNT_0001481563 /DNA_START=704 /DNA_END=1159 /DNA_ORIENTATION=+
MTIIDCEIDNDSNNIHILKLLGQSASSSSHTNTTSSNHISNLQSSGDGSESEDSDKEGNGSENEDKSKRSALVNALAILHILNDTLQFDLKKYIQAPSSSSASAASLDEEEENKKLICEDMLSILESSAAWQKSKDQHHDLMTDSVAYLTV